MRTNVPQSYLNVLPDRMQILLAASAAWEASGRPRADLVGPAEDQRILQATFHEQTTARAVHYQAACKTTCSEIHVRQG